MKILLRKTILNYRVILIVILSVFQITTATEVKITASDQGGGDYFGRSVSISGDYAVVGAFYESPDNEGAAYIYYRNQDGPDTWGEVTKLTASDLDPNDEFGRSVAISGDYAIVGAWHEDGGTGDPYSNAGAAYIYYRNQGGTNNWGEVTKITASDTASGDEFGFSVAISGDYAIVGAAGVDGGGAAYIFYRNQGGANNWGEVTKITASDAASGDEFGYSVAIDGESVIVGARYENAGGPAAQGGSAYIFYRNQGGSDNWGQVTKILAGDVQAFARFGYSVSISGDYAISSACYEDVGGNGDAGAAYIFYRNEGGTDNWGQVAKITASDIGAGDLFGFSASISGDYVIVGAWYESEGGSEAGAAYSFLRDGSSWNQTSKTMASDAQANDRFGCSVSISGDYAIVGAYLEDGGTGDPIPNTGAAYVYESIADLALPVELSSFTAIAGDGKVTLEWTTESEIDNRAFILERSDDNKIFTMIAELEGQGSTSHQTNYSYTDFSVTNGLTYFYRLADRSINGVVTLHNTIVATPIQVFDKFILYNNYPNPFNPETTIHFDIPEVKDELTNIKLQVYNALGKLVDTLYKGKLAGGHYKMKWNGANQSSGVYFLVLKSEQIVQTQKMILLR